MALCAVRSEVDNRFLSLTSCHMTGLLTWANIRSSMFGSFRWITDAATWRSFGANSYRFVLTAKKRDMTSELVSSEKYIDSLGTNSNALTYSYTVPAM